ncbi:MAG: pentapeptide repeat-containing protein [Thermodesulfobacteriota bacterium]
MRRRGTGALRPHWLGILLLVVLAFLLLIYGFPLAQENQETEPQKPWTGKLKDGQVITQDDLDWILQEHALWITSKGREGEPANLEGADLRRVELDKANLSRVSLRKANLSGAFMTEANLSGAWLHEANLSGVDLFMANLSGAKIDKANLSRARLSSANLNRAYLRDADLSQARLNGANLSRANLYNSNLSGADLFMANLDGALLDWADLSRAKLKKANLSKAWFEPRPGSVSDVSLLLHIKGLPSLRYLNSSHGLVELREAYKKAGLREEERQVTFALNHTRREKLWKKGDFLGKLESYFHLVCFEWPCQYGMNPGRPLKILGLGLFLFTPFYLLALRNRDRETGLWLVLPPDRILGQGSKVRPFKLTGCTPFRPLPPGRWPRVKARLLRGLRRVRLAFYFSLLFAFNLGWRELNVGNWISRLQKHEYTLRATGWPRTVAGLQSLLSVYLLALWVLSYFGRPFD